MSISVPKSKITSSSLGYLWIDDQKTEELESELEWVPCIQYPVTFKDQIEALLNSRSEVNAMNPAFASELGFQVQKTNVGAQKLTALL